MDVDVKAGAAGAGAFDPGSLSAFLAESQAIIGSIKASLAGTDAVRDLAARMRNCSPKGMPARARKAEPVCHTAEGLNEEI